MQQYGNQTTYNLETVLQQNIRNADFYKNDCLKLNNWTQVIDQIFYQVDYVEPWLAGNARGPSTAFCLLYRLFELKPSEDEVHATITHEDSPYIRAVGFLYLRYVADPRQLWDWLEPYCEDKEEIQPSGPNGPTVTVGDFVRDLLLEQYYFETIFPRIPKKVEDDIQAELRRRNLPTKGKGNGGCGGADRRGGDDGNRRPASVKASLSVAFGQRAPNRAGTKAWKDDNIKTAAGARGPSVERVRDRSREQQRSGDERRGGERGYNGRSSSREQPRDRYSSYSSYDSRDRDRDRGGRDYDRQYERGSSRDRRDYDRDRDYDRRDYDRRPDYDRRDRSSRDEPRRRSSRSRSRSRSPARSRGGGGRDASDVFKERVGGAAATDVRSRYGDASGKLDLGPSGSTKRSADEVFRLGGRSYR